MGCMNYKKFVKQCIEDIPNSKLVDGIPDSNTVHTDRYMRFDNQRTITLADGSKAYNLQVQVHFDCPDTTLKRMAPDIIAMRIAPIEPEWSAARIEEDLVTLVTRNKLSQGEGSGVVVRDGL